jgi:16S rRNA (guanine527-N7)-methyltransferase
MGPREAPRVWQRHILNCAVISPAFAASQTVCDLGSGAGLPGIVLAVARPDLHLTLLEPLLRRATFLDEVVSSLALDNVVVRRGRAEELTRTDVFDVVTARAVAPLEKLARWALPLLGAGGELIAIKGRAATDEIAAARLGLAALGAGRVQVETYGRGIVDPETTVVRIESGRTQPRAKGARE